MQQFRVSDSEIKSVTFNFLPLSFGLPSSFRERGMIANTTEYSAQYEVYGYNDFRKPNAFLPRKHLTSGSLGCVSRTVLCAPCSVLCCSVLWALCYVLCDVCCVLCAPCSA